MDRKELIKLHESLKIAQELRNCYGWDGTYSAAVPKECLCDIQLFFSILNLQINLKKFCLPDVSGHTNGGLTLEWEKTIEIDGKYFFDFLALTFFGNKTISLESDLRYLGLKKREEFEIISPLDETIIEYIKYF